MIFVDQMGIDELKILFSNVMRLFLLDNFLMHQSFSFHRDTHNNESRTQRNRRYRSTSSSECITDEHGENRLYPIEWLNYYFHFTQTITSLNLEWNKIGAAEAYQLASALQVNTVRIDCIISNASTTISISHRHSQRWISTTTILAMRGHSIWQMPYKWIR